MYRFFVTSLTVRVAGAEAVAAPALDQVVMLEELDFGQLRYDSFSTHVVKSCIHFRRGFDENGFAKTIIIVMSPSALKSVVIVS